MFTNYIWVGCVINIEYYNNVYFKLIYLISIYFFFQCKTMHIYTCEFGGLFFGHGRPITMSACLPLEQHKTDCENLSRATLSKKKFVNVDGLGSWKGEGEGEGGESVGGGIWSLHSPLFINSWLLRLSCPLLTRLRAVCFYQHCPDRQATSDEKTNGQTAVGGGTPGREATNVHITFL